MQGIYTKAGAPCTIKSDSPIGQLTSILYLDLCRVDGRVDVAPKTGKTSTAFQGEQMMTANESMASRALLALMLMLGFYLLVVVIVAGLVVIPLLLFTKSPAIAIKIGIPCWIVAYVIVRSALPRFGSYETPGVEITAEQQPELFSMVREVARKTSQRMPERIYMVPDANAMVYEKGGFFGLLSTRVLCLGYPLFPILNVSELKSIIAHEFGHYSGGDTSLGPWIHTSRASAIETAVVLDSGGSWLSPLFVGYAKFYLKITQKISRAQEFLADRIAARTVGIAASVSSLEKAALLQLTWRDFFNGELIGVLRRSLFPPLSAGYQTFYQDPRTHEVYREVLEQIHADETTDEFDSHPSIQERVGRLRSLGFEQQSVNERPALTLLRRVEEVERQIVVFATEDIAVFNFAPVEWSQTREKVTMPNLAEDLLRWPELVESLTPAKLPAGRTAFDLTVQNARQPREMPFDIQQREAIALYTIATALALRLYEAGWELQDEIGRSVQLRKGQTVINPSIVVRRLVSEPTYRQEWASTCEESGIGDLRFSEISCLANRRVSLGG